MNEDGTSTNEVAILAEKIDAYVARVGNARIVKGPWYEMCKCPWEQ